MRFDEIELESVPLGIEEEPPPVAAVRGTASYGKRFLALLTDLSLFAALILGLSPLLPQPYTWPHLLALSGFVVVLSYYYFVGTWMLWGKTIGGAIFDVRVSTGSMSLRDASVRWATVYLTLLVIGCGWGAGVLMG
jgi:hypothetical protein